MNEANKLFWKLRPQSQIEHTAVAQSEKKFICRANRNQIQALTKALNKGCGFNGRDLNSG